MEFPVRCFTCLRVIGNKYETFAEMQRWSYAKVAKWASTNELRAKAFDKHVVKPREKEDKKRQDKDPEVRLSDYEILSLLKVKHYCCRALFLTHVDIPLPDPDYLEKTFSRVKFLNKRSSLLSAAEGEEEKDPKEILKEKLKRAIRAR